MKSLISLLGESAEVLVQIGDWAVWPSGQHMPLFNRFRQAFGEHRPLIKAPGHVIPASERDDAVSILVLSVLYLWNCHVLSAKGDQALFVSHESRMVRRTRRWIAGTREPVARAVRSSDGGRTC